VRKNAPKGLGSGGSVKAAFRQTAKGVPKEWSDSKESSRRSLPQNHHSVSPNRTEQVKDETIALYKQHASWHRYNYEQLQEMKKGLQECADLKEIADYGYALKRMSELVDDTRKELNKLCETAQHLQCAIQVEMQDISPVKTEYCTASSKVDFYAPLPKLSTDPDAYYDLCEEFGITREAADCEAFRLH
jgi:hypothetical protein